MSSLGYEAIIHELTHNGSLNRDLETFKLAFTLTSFTKV